MIDLIINTLIITLVVYFATNKKLSQQVYATLAVTVLVTLVVLKNVQTRIEPFETNESDDTLKNSSYYCDGDVCHRVNVSTDSVENCLPRTATLVNSIKPKTEECDLLDNVSESQQESDNEDIHINLDSKIPTNYFVENRFF
jgi:hypothetical protein